MKKLIAMILGAVVALPVALPVAAIVPLAVAVPTQATAGHWCNRSDTSRRCVNVYACVRAGYDRYTCEERHRWD